MTETIDAGQLRIAYEAHGRDDGWPVVLLHGFPYDVHAFDDCAGSLAREGARVVVPYLRGYGPTRFLRADTLRSGEQAALGADLRALLDALGIERAIVGGFDWGGRAACVVAALFPERVAGLVTAGGYNIQDIARSGTPTTPENEHRMWYQYYFHGERGRTGLERHRAEFCRLLWSLWSPTWRFDDATYRRSATAFDNPDFVDVVIHSYRHRFGLVAGDPEHAAIEAALAAQPSIRVPTVALFGGADGVAQVRGAASGEPPRDPRFTGAYRGRVLEQVGHNPPQEAPDAFVEAVLEVRHLGSTASAG